MGRVGPVLFTREEPRAYLEQHGEVFTFRTSDRTTGGTHVRYERTGKKQHDCTIQKWGDVAGEDLDRHLDLLAEAAGFADGNEWREAIREIHGDVPDSGYIYHVCLIGADSPGSDWGPL